MSKKEQSLTVRAAQAVKSDGATIEELTALQREIIERIQVVDGLLRRADADVESAMASGDLEELRKVRQTQAETQDEDKVLHRLRSDLAQSIKVAEGEAAMANQDKLQKQLEGALAKADEAQALRAEAVRMAERVVIARQKAQAIGHRLDFDHETIRTLSDRLYPDSTNSAKQLQINLGAANPQRALRSLL